MLLSKCAGLEVTDPTAEYLFLMPPDVWFSPNSANPVSAGQTFILQKSVNMHMHLSVDAGSSPPCPGAVEEDSIRRGVQLSFWVLE